MNTASFDNIARDLLESAPGLEVVTSFVELPPHFRAPTHTHPGEEFAYLVEGTVHSWEQGRGELELGAGGTCRVPIDTAHTIWTAAEPAKLVAFRVHPVGAPERIPLEVEVAGCGDPDARSSRLADTRGLRSGQPGRRCDAVDGDGLRVVGLSGRSRAATGRTSCGRS